MKMNLVRTLLTITILVFLTSSAYPQWIQTDWSQGSNFFDIYSNQDSIFARIWDFNDAGRVFFTDDSGQNWTQISSAQDDIDILSIVMLDDTILAGTWDGFYKCTLEEPYWNWEFFDTIGISEDSHIWSIKQIDDMLFANTGASIYESSTENFDEWAQVSVGIPENTRIKSFLINGNAIFAGSSSNGVFITTDGETDWTAVNSGLTDLRVSQLEAIGTKLFAITKHDGVFVTDSNGLDWVSNPNTITWEAYSPDIERINCFLTSNDLLFAGTDSNGVYFSADEGLNWTPFSVGLPDNSRILSLAEGGIDIYAGTDEGIWRINPVDFNEYVITASALEGGAISPEGDVTVYQTGFKKFTITPSQGYTISDVIVDGNSVGAVSTYTFTDINDNHTITANFLIAPYTITASSNGGGVISPSGTFSVIENSSHTFMITPSDGYEIADVTVDNVSVGAVDTYTFSSVTSDHTIEVLFDSLAIYKINCGGSDSSEFAADQYYDEGIVLSVESSIDTSDVTEPAPEEVYQSERYYSEMSYIFPGLNSEGSYKVRLHFSENLLGNVGFRRFNVTINGTEVLSNYDIFAEAGEKFKAVVKEFSTTADESGYIQIDFESVGFYAKIGGIEIVKQ